VRTANGDFEMSNQSYGGLFWNSPAGVLIEATDLATKKNRSNRKHECAPGALRTGQARSNGAWHSRPGAVAAAGLVFVGCTLCATLIITMAA
jgi:hypothetical protein